METIYTIRTRVLDMPMDMWVKFRDLYGEVEIFETTKPQFLENVGLPGGLSARYNEEEKRFFEQIYGQWREQN